MPDRRTGFAGTARATTALAVLLAATAGAARAHEVVPGIGGFAGQLLHPYFVPELTLSLAGMVVLCAHGPVRAIAPAFLAFCAGMVAAKGIENAAPAFMFRIMVIHPGFLVPVLTGVLVMGLRRLPFGMAFAMAFMLGAVLAMGTVAERTGIAGLAEALAANMLAGAIPLLAIAWPLASAERPSIRLGVRIAASWLAAIAGLGFAVSMIPTA